MDFGPEGLDLGVRRISLQEWEDRVACGSTTETLLEIDSRGAFPRDRVREFMQNEKDLLARAIEALRESSGPGGASEECRALLREIDYSWVQFPDPPGLEAPTGAFFPGPGWQRGTTPSDWKGSPQSSEVLSTARNADCGSSTSPTIFMRFLPSFCFSRSFLLRVMSPP